MKFRKKPIEIEAIQLINSPESICEVLRFMGRKVNTESDMASQRFEEYCRIVQEEGMKIYTLEGTMIASIGDWVIKGVNGEFYPCKPDIFEKTYESIN